MQQSDTLPTGERITVVHTASSWTESIVVRGLLESAGIASPALGSSNPSPMPELSPFFHGFNVYALDSQAAQARRIIADYLAVAGEDADENPAENDDDEF